MSRRRRRGDLAPLTLKDRRQKAERNERRGRRRARPAPRRPRVAKVAISKRERLDLGGILARVLGVERRRGAPSGRQGPPKPQRPE